MVLAVERVRERLLRAAKALESANIPYAVAGGNAVAAWVATVEPSAVRNTLDVDVLLRRTDLEAATRALEAAGFVHRKTAGVDMFLDGPEARVRDAVHIVFAREKVLPNRTEAAPDVDESDKTDQFRVVTLQSLVRMKLTSFRDKDRAHLRDMLEVGLIDGSWVNRFTPELGARLQELIDTPEG
ncbi:MAG TPA: hypothetical protein VGI81_21260 [Tepidisphaeraceae bacterium]